MSSTEILKLFMIVAFLVLIITNLSAVAESDSDNNQQKSHYDHVKTVKDKVIKK